MPSDNFATLLSLTGTGFSLSEFSLRGLTATLTTISQSAQMDRDINGNLIDLSNPSFRKYRVTITCTDQESPAFAGVWPGTTVTVVLIPQLGAASPLSLNCAVVEPWTESADEWGAENTWNLVLEEV